MVATDAKSRTYHFYVFPLYCNRPSFPESCHNLLIWNLVELIIIVSFLRRLSPVERGPVVRVERPAVPQPLHQVWVGDEVPAEHDGVGLVALELGRGVVAVEAARREELDARRLQDIPELRQVVGLLGGATEGRQLLLLVEDLVEAGLDPVDGVRLWPYEMQ